MIKRWLKQFHRSKAGFMLVDMLAAITITCIISLGASVGIGQMMTQNSRNNDLAVASRNAENALHWMARDAIMSQTVTGTSVFPASGTLSMQWRGWDNTSYTANYTVISGQLRRTYSDGHTTSMTVISQNINQNGTKTNCVSQNGTVTITITSTTGEGSKTVDVTKSRTISSRPNL